MLPEYKQLIETAVSRRKLNAGFLRKLAARQPADLDQKAAEFHEEAFVEIDCLKCANCCRTTGPLLRDKDISALASESRLRPADFTAKYLKIDEDNDYVFKSMPCPFLGADNHCSVYSCRPTACRTYPHTDKQFSRHMQLTLRNSVICPAVAIILEKLKAYYQKL